MQIIKREPQQITVVTANGTELVCVPVRTLPIQDLMFKIGLPSRITDSANATEISEALQRGSSAQQMDAIKASMALFNYCMAYGVTTNPPEEAVEELKSLGLAPRTLPALRATWLNYMVLEDTEEASLLAGIVMGVTKTSNEQAKEQAKPTPVKPE